MARKIIWSLLQNKTAIVCGNMKVLEIIKKTSKQNIENGPFKKQEGNLHILKNMCKYQKSADQFREGR